MADLTLGGTGITDVKLGSAQITSVYKGADKIWSALPPFELVSSGLVTRGVFPETGTTVLDKVRTTTTWNTQGARSYGVPVAAREAEIGWGVAGIAGNNAALRVPAISTNSVRSFSFWFYIDSSIAGTKLWSSAGQLGAGNENYYGVQFFFSNAGATTLSCQSGDGGSPTSSSRYSRAAIFPQGYAPDQWNHAVLSFSSTSSRNLTVTDCYLNGVQATGLGNSSGTGSSRVRRTGRWGSFTNWNTNVGLAGIAFADYREYSGALSAADVAKIFAGNG